MRLPDLATVERHWLAGLATVVLGHGAGHAAVDLGFAQVALVLGAALVIGGPLWSQWLVSGRLFPRLRSERRLWLRRLDSDRPPVRNEPTPLPADIDRAMVATLIAWLFGVTLIVGVFVPGIAPAATELVVGASLVALYWVSSTSRTDEPG